MCVWLCAFLGLRDESDLVRGLEQVLGDGGHDHLRMGLGLTEISGALQAEQTLHGAKALLNTETAFGDQLIEALFGDPQRTPSGGLSQDAVAVVSIFQGGTVGLAGIGFVSHYALRMCARDHGFKLRAFGRVGRPDMDFIDEAFLVCAGEAFVAKRAYGALFDPPGVRIGAIMHLRGVWRAAFLAVLRASI